MAQFHYAIEIDCSDSVPTLDSTDFGMINGVYYLITDAPGLNGTPTVIGHANDIWYDGILSDDGLNNVYQRIDIETAGGYVQPSSFNFKVNNTTGFWDFNRSQEVLLTGRSVKLYIVEKTDTTEFTFTQIWTGKIENIPYNEKDNVIDCIDTINVIHNRLEFPPTLLSQNKESGITSVKENIDAAYPISLGKINKAKLFKTYNFIDSKKYYRFNDPITGKLLEPIFFPCVQYLIVTSDPNRTVVQIRLKTADNNFATNELKGYYIRGFGGPDTGIHRIIASAVTGSSVSGETIINIAEALEEEIPAGSIWSQTNTSVEVQYYSIFKSFATSIVSTSQIYGYKNVENVWTFKEEEFLETSEFTQLGSLGSGTFVGSGTSSLPFMEAHLRQYPGIYFDLNLVNDPKKGILESLKFFTPAVIVLREKFKSSPPGTNFTFITNADAEVNFPTIGGIYDTNPQALCPFLHDKLNSVRYQQSIQASIVGAFDIKAQMNFRVYLPAEMLKRNYDHIYVISNQTAMNPVSTKIEFMAACQLQDLQARTTRFIPSDLNVSINNADHVVFTVNPAVAASFYDANLIPTPYFPSSGGVEDTEVTERFNTHKYKLDISEVVSDEDGWQTFVPPLVYMNYMVRFSGSGAGTNLVWKWRINEIMFVSGTTIELENDDFFTSITGEVFHTNAEYNTRRTFGNPVLLLPDAIEYIMRKYENSDDTEIDTTSIDNLVTTSRINWGIGFQVNDKSDDGILTTIKDLAKFGFLGIGVDNLGKRYFKAWRDNTAPTFDLNENDFLRGSLKDVKYTPLSKIFNQFEVQYDKNYANDTFNKKIGIQKVTEASFPAEYVTGNDFTKSYNSIINVVPPAQFPEILFAFVINVTTLTYDITKTIAVGKYTSLVNNTNGYSYVVGRIFQIINHGGSFSLLVEAKASVFFGASTTGTLYIQETNVQLWKNYAFGIVNYSHGKSLWEKCHDSYNQFGFVRKLPSEFSDAYVYSDLNRFNSTLENDKNNIIAENDDNNPALKYLTELIEWTTLPKRIIEFSLPLNTAFLGIKVLDPMNFTDQRLSEGLTLLGWVTKKEINIKDDKIDIELIIDTIDAGVVQSPPPPDFATDFIDENTETLDFIDEDTTNSDFIDEDG